MNEAFWCNISSRNYYKRFKGNHWASNHIFRIRAQPVFSITMKCPYVFPTWISNYGWLQIMLSIKWDCPTEIYHSKVRQRGIHLLLQESETVWTNRLQYFEASQKNMKIIMLDQHLRYGGEVIETPCTRLHIRELFGDLIKEDIGGRWNHPSRQTGKGLGVLIIERK